MLNIVVSATDYFADRSGIVSGNYIMIDDVTLLYYSELATCTYDGTTVNFTNGTATVDAFYDASKISYTSNGHGAAIEKSFNDETQVLTITVKGEDISENTSNYHTYTIQFKQYEANLTSATYNGNAVSFTNGTATVDAFYHDVTMAYEKSERASVSESFDEATQKLTITVTSGDGRLTNTYTIQFKQYTYAMTSVTYDGTTVTADANGIYQVDTYYDKYDATKLVPVGSDEKVTFEKSAMNTTTKQVTVTAKSGNYDNDGKSNTYTFQFKSYEAKLTSATYDGSTVSFANSQTVTLDKFYDASKLGTTFVASEGAEVTTSYDGTNYKLTLHVTSKDGNATQDYYIQFKYEANLTATYDNNDVTFGTDNSATVDAFYDATKLNLTASDAATTTTSLNEQTQLLTITVKSGDNKTTNTYTIQFKPYEAEIVSATYNGTAISFTNRTAELTNVRYDEAKLSVTPSDGATYEKSFNSDTQLLTIVVTSGNGAKTNTYTIQFPTSFNYTLTGGEGHWGTFCYPGAVTSITGAEVYSIAGKNKADNPTYISLTQEKTFPLVAGKPYIYLATTNDAVELVTDAQEAALNNDNSNGLIGVYKKTVLSAISENTYKIDDNTVVKMTSETGTSIAANCAWINISKVHEYPGTFDQWIPFANVQKGDVNLDGSVTIADVTALVNIILGKDISAPYLKSAADVNSDGNITIADVTALVNTILGKTQN